jgi:hypothetical protein
VSVLNTIESSVPKPAAKKVQQNQPKPSKPSESNAVQEPEVLLTVEGVRNRVFAELQGLGFTIKDDRIQTEDLSREVVKKLHQPACESEIRKAATWIRIAWKKHSHWFANGSDIVPELINPVLQQVITREHKEVFRLARYTWSLPFSRGFGRRLQFLVIDDHSKKLIGILGMQSPPLSFPARDRKFEIPKDRKPQLVNQTLDIYTLGAIPPFNLLLGGKLVALAAASNEVRAAYHQKYKSRATEMEDRKIPANLVALTTTSAFGRSSIYNRLKYANIVTYEHLGYTEGYGAFHLDALYPLFKQFLELKGINTQGGYGTGPRRKWQIINLASDLLGIPRGLLKNGVKREAFLIPLIENLSSFLSGSREKPRYIDVKFATLAEFWKQRWMLPRFESQHTWREWNKESNFLFLREPEK